jgi:hypothetical protein
MWPLQLTRIHSFEDTKHDVETNKLLMMMPHFCFSSFENGKNFNTQLGNKTITLLSLHVCFYLCKLARIDEKHIMLARFEVSSSFYLMI